MRLSRMVAVQFAGLLTLPCSAARADPLAEARSLTSVQPQCRSAVRGDDILVCGRRDADRYRVPFDGYPDGDPRNETVSGERNRLARAPTLPCGIAAFLSNCGSVGVAFSLGLAGEVRYRKLAP